MKLKDLAFKYAEDIIDGKELTTWEMEYLAKKIINDYNVRQHEEDFPYYFDEEWSDKIEGLLSLMVYPTGFCAGDPIPEHIAPFQAFFIVNLFCWRYKDTPYKNRFNNIVLYIVRKCGKTFITAVVFILLMLTEQKNSEFYSVCHTKELASILRTQIAQIITSSPALSKHFFVSKSDMGKIKCLLNNSWYEPRVAEANKNNGIRPSVFCADEVGAFKDRSNINAMQSGQKNVLNPMRISTTTAYAIKIDK